MAQREWHNEGGPAFAHGDREHGGDPGMSLRDWFAGQALAGIMANVNVKSVPDAEVARAAYLHADNMLAQRAK